MLIDWFTVGAQALNFLILVWLMKRFLYKPVLSAIDAREKSVAAEIADAGAKKAEAQKEKDDFKKKNDDFESARSAMLAKAEGEAVAERKRLMDQAREAADALAAKRQEALEYDARALDQALGRKVSQQVFAVARKALNDLAGSSLEERMVAVFLRKLRGMPSGEGDAFGQALKSGPDPAVIRSAFELLPQQRDGLQKGLNEFYSADINLRYETVPDLIGGIELDVKGQKMAWTIADYVASMEKEVADLMKKKAKPEPAKPEPAKPEPAKPEPAKPEAVKPEAVKPEAVKPEAVKPEAVKPEAVKPEAAKPETAKPETAKPETAKPEAAKPETAKPEAAKPEPTKSETPKSEVWVP